MRHSDKCLAIQPLLSGTDSSGCHIDCPVGRVRESLAEWKLKLAGYGISRAQAEKALDSPEYRRRTAAGRRWAAGRPWLDAAWNIRSAEQQLREMEAAPGSVVANSDLPF